MVRKMKNAQLEKIGNMGVNPEAGEGAFSPTPAEPAQQMQIKKIQIDLSELYIFNPKTPAAITLENILQNYSDAKTVALVNISPDVGLEVLIDLYNIAEKLFKEEEDDLVAEQKVAEELAKRLQKNITVIELLDGYEAAIAWMVMEK
jgi:hypothetical protein